MNVNPHQPLYYKGTGRPAELLAVDPVVKYRVRYSNGATAELSAEEFERQMTNVPPRMTFQVGYAAGHLIVEGMEREVKVKLRRKYADFPGQSLSATEAQDLHRRLGDWLRDRGL